MLIFVSFVDVLTFHIHAQNAALIMRRRKHFMRYEIFEVTPPPETTMQIEGKLICSYPGPALEVPLADAQNLVFVQQLSSFLIHMDVDYIEEALPFTSKAGSSIPETRSTAHPRYISQLLSMILLAMGREASIPRITKRIADDVVCSGHGGNPWHRSPLWLVLRVAIQTTAESREMYKAFMIFFQARLLQLFLEYDFSADRIHSARVKTIRRAYKLGAAAPPFVLEALKVTGDEIQAELQSRWGEEQRSQSETPALALDPLEFEAHTVLSLNNSRAYLTRVLHPEIRTHTADTFNPSHHSRLRSIEDFSRALGAEPALALPDIELFVSNQLERWTSARLHLLPTLEAISSCMEVYISASTKSYASNPEDLSIMVLTILQLWVALDRITLTLLPMLADYPPEIPSTILEPLLLRHTTYLERAAYVEVYLRNRRTRATEDISIFSSGNEEKSFAIRHFNDTHALHDLKAEIEGKAEQDRVKKLEELEEKNIEYRRLMREVDGLTCTCEWHVDRRGRRSRYGTCRRCRLQDEARAMTIEVHEWPLPELLRSAQAVVFELRCPKALTIWRARTYQVLRDIGMEGTPTKREIASTLTEYGGLRTWSRDTPVGRLVFGSRTRSFYSSHFGAVHLPASSASVCVKHGHTYSIYDGGRQEFAHSEFDDSIDFSRYGTLQLRESPRPTRTNLCNLTCPTPPILTTKSSSTKKTVHLLLVFTNSSLLHLFVADLFSSG